VKALNLRCSRILADIARDRAVCLQEVVDLIAEAIRHFESLGSFRKRAPPSWCGSPPASSSTGRYSLKNSHARTSSRNPWAVVPDVRLFLICSIDFIVSVGLSAEVSLSNLPVTLGSMLAKLGPANGHTRDRKVALTDVKRVLPRSRSGAILQWISVAFLIVYTLVCVLQGSPTG